MLNYRKQLIVFGTLLLAAAVADGQWIKLNTLDMGKRSRVVRIIASSMAGSASGSI